MEPVAGLSMRDGEERVVTAMGNREILSAWAWYGKSGTFWRVESELFLDA
jgi:hypothetical protein